MNLRIVVLMVLMVLMSCGLPGSAPLDDAGRSDAGSPDAGSPGRSDGGYSLDPNVVYSTRSPLCVMDVAVPAGAGPFPTVIFIHGGGWAPTGRAAFASEVRAWASRGYTAATIDYLGRAAGWKEIVKSVKTAVKYLKAHAAEYRVDVNRVGVVGSSAGGHLAAMVATTADDATLSPGEFAEYSDRVQVAVTLSASYDLTTNWNDTGDPGYVRPILETVFGGGPGQTPLLSPQGYIDGSPLTHVSADDARFCINHGTADLTAPVQQAAMMESALRAAGVPVQTHLVDGAPHIWADTSFQPLWEADLASCLSDALE